MKILGIKKCPECGALYGADDKFCTKCGRDLISMTFEHWWTTFKHWWGVRESQGPDYAKASLRCSCIGFIIFLFYPILYLILFLTQAVGRCHTPSTWWGLPTCENFFLNIVAKTSGAILLYMFLFSIIIIPVMIILLILGMIFAWKSLQLTEWKDNKPARRSITIALIPLLTILIFLLLSLF